MLEEGSFRGRTADFVYMFIFGCITTVVIMKICINSLFQVFSNYLLSHVFRYVLGL